MGETCGPSYVEDHAHPRMILLILQTVKRLIKSKMAYDIEGHIIVPSHNVHYWLFGRDFLQTLD